MMIAGSLDAGTVSRRVGSGLCFLKQTQPNPRLAHRAGHTIMTTPGWSLPALNLFCLSPSRSEPAAAGCLYSTFPSVTNKQSQVSLRAAGIRDPEEERQKRLRAGRHL